MNTFAESTVESAALSWLEALGYTILHGPDIGGGQPTAERSDPNAYDEVLESTLPCGSSGVRVAE